MESQEIETAARIILNCSYSIHKEMGPGLLESAYEQILEVELLQQGLLVERQISLPIIYKGYRIENAFRADLLVNSQIILEIKACERMQPVFARQVLTYLKFSNRRLGFVLNFGCGLMKDGIERVVNNL
ncbi:MAG: GxxExxY protein [Candidatus Sumerlaeia bacterium]|nr:GxxExxY protein [Candidatus Sumerlaeia bacterium]